MVEVGLTEPQKPRLVVSLCCDGQIIEESDIPDHTWPGQRVIFRNSNCSTQPLAAMVRNILAETIDLFHQGRRRPQAGGEYARRRPNR